MATLKIHKVLSSLPGTLDPNSVYFVRVGSGIDVYVTDTTGLIAYKHNDTTGGGGTDNSFKLAGLGGF